MTEEIRPDSDDVGIESNQTTPAAEPAAGENAVTHAEPERAPAPNPPRPEGFDPKFWDLIVA